MLATTAAAMTPVAFALAASTSPFVSSGLRHQWVCPALPSHASGRARGVRMTLPVPIEAFEALKPRDGKKRVNIGVIGAGHSGQVHAEHITFRLRNANLVGICSGTKELADRCSLEHGCKPYYDYHELIEDPNVDALCICSNSELTNHIIAAAQAGKDIFCDRLKHTDLAVIDNALAEVRKSGVKFQVGFNRRYDQNYRRLKQGILAGEIGKPQMLHIVSRDPKPPSMEYIKKSGGIWMDSTIRDLDMSRHLIGDEVEEVYTLGAVNINPEIQLYNDVDTSIVTLRFKNGVIGTIDNSRQAVYGYDQRCEVLGSGGSIEINNNYHNSAVISNSSEVKRDLPHHFFKDRYTESFVEELKEFCTAVLKDKPITCTGLDGRAPVVIAIAAKKSYLERRAVRLSEVDIPLREELVGWDGQGR